ncbi:MAG: BRcat domain-containing protein [Gemmataceae bacterium]
MAAGIPCPNPSCSEQFSPEQIRGAAKLVCPRCGLAFRLRSGPPQPPNAPTPPPLPPSKGQNPGKKAPPQPPPLASPVPHQIPGKLASVPRQTPPPERGDSSAPDLVDLSPPLLPSVQRKRKRRGGSSLWKKGLALLLALSPILGSLYYFRGEVRDILNSSLRKKVPFPKGNFALGSVGGYQDDEALRERFRGKVALSQSQPRSHFVVDYRDLETKEWNEGVLVDRAVKRLRAYFPRLEYESPFHEGAEASRDEVDGQPAIRFTFAGMDPSQVPMRGQCWTFQRQGFAYWLFFFGPEDDFDLLDESWQGLREQFSFLNQRKGWKPASPPTETYRLIGVPAHLKYVKELWKREPNPRDADEYAELLLRGFEVSEDEDTGRRRTDSNLRSAAEVQVLVLPRSRDLKTASESARKHFQKKWQELYNSVKVDPLLDGQSKKPIVGVDMGVMRGQVDALRVLFGQDDERFAIIGVANRPEGVLAILGECRMDRRTYWEEEFRAIIQSLQLNEKPENPSPPSEDPSPDSTPAKKSD